MLNPADRGDRGNARLTRHTLYRNHSCILAANNLGLSVSKPLRTARFNEQALLHDIKHALEIRGPDRCDLSSEVGVVFCAQSSRLAAMSDEDHGPWLARLPPDILERILALVPLQDRRATAGHRARRFVQRHIRGHVLLMSRSACATCNLMADRSR